MTEDRLTELDAQSCRQLLASTSLGRLAVNDEPSPLVVPVNYVMHGDSILFRSAAGAKLEASRGHRAMATFEVDGIDVGRRSGWSVVVQGPVEVVVDPGSDVLDAVGRVAPLPGGDRPHVVAVHLETVTGRRIATDGAWFLGQSDTTQWTGQDASDLLG